MLAEISGEGALLHHGALIENGPPLPVAVALFAMGWIVMVAAMMLPASMPVIGVVSRSRHALQFGFAFFGTWLVFGLLCFAGDMTVHRIVDSTPVLGQRPWLVEAGLAGFVGLYQFTGLKRSALRLCRRPDMTAHGDAMPLRAGVGHALDCIGASGALMLLAFGAGFANLAWMAVLTGVMTYETRGRGGETMVRAAGLALLLLATFALVNEGLPAWLPG